MSELVFDAMIRERSALTNGERLQILDAMKFTMN
jgi:hypothetical protein